jgi:outer membrane receptor protein involved in Fe transport
MKKIIVAVSSLLAFISPAFADDNPDGRDSVKTYLLDEIVVTSSFKETNKLSSLPGAVSVLSSSQLKGLNVANLKDISTMLPNFFIPDYGSKMNSPIYIRGVGNRITSQASGMYVDRVPILNKAGYDFELLDIRYVELLRGPQGTLFGRNSMGGLLNVYTISPLDFQKTEFGVTGGNHGLFRAKASTYAKMNDKAGISLSAYYDRNDGYFTNAFTGNKADNLEAAGGRLRFDYRFSDAWKASVTASYDFSDQGAFPYKRFDAATGTTFPINYNDEGSYLRKTGLAALNLEYSDDRVLLNSTTSFQGLNDRMNMDQDYSPEDLYSINQKQIQQSFTEEITLKSNTSSPYQWTFGAFGFYDKFRTDMQVDWTKAGIQSNLDRATANAPVTLTVVNDEIPNPGLFDTPSYGAAVYHQSTYNFTEGLSATVGIRLDYGKTDLDYRSSIAMDIMSQPGPPAPIHLDTALQGRQTTDYLQALPKFALKYEFDRQHYVYASATKGFNPGGYNIQLFAELIMQTLFTASPIDMTQAVPFDPEYSWTYEAGYKGELLKDRLSVEAALFYVDMADMQLAQYTNYGRLLENAGKATSKGVDLQLNAQLFAGMTAGVNYGFTHATFTDYNNGRDGGDFKGHYLPFVPRHTFSLYAAYRKAFDRAPIDRINLHAQYSGADKIFWTEANSIAQDFYGLLNLKAGIGKGCFTLNLWTKNTLDARYNTFYFEMQGNSFLQQGKPFRCGADLVVSF